MLAPGHDPDSGPRPAAGKHPDLIYDVGMHRGEDADFYLKKGFRVIGVEADPELAQHCRKRFEPQIQAGRLTLVEGAVVDPETIRTPGQTISFYSNLDQSVWGTAIPNWARRNEGSGTRISEVRVRALGFGDVLARYGIPYFMKVDIEGADRFCLEALLPFDVKPDYLSIESETVDSGRAWAELDLLERLDYTDFQVVQQAWVPRQAPPNPSREGVYVDFRFEPGASGLFGKELPDSWAKRDEMSAVYRSILRRERYFGSASIFRKNRLGRKALALLRKVSGHPLPGWYDTHARHRSAAI